MLVAFFLSMPNSPSWNGKWSGAGRKYVIVKRFNKTIKATEKARKILADGIHGYGHSWSDGWSARVDVKEVTTEQARQLRKESVGFAGYDWMVNTIMLYGKILDDDGVKAYYSERRAATIN